MSRATPQMRAFAEVLIAHESSENPTSATKRPADFPVFEKLRSPLAMLMGNGGFRALLSRALALARAEVPWLRAVHVNADGALEGLKELHARLDPDEYFEGRAQNYLLPEHIEKIARECFGLPIGLREIHSFKELAAKLKAEKDVTVHPASLSRVLLKAGLSFKKNTAGLGGRARGRAPGA